MNVHDEVCGMSIKRDGAAAEMSFQGKRYFFCSDRCRRKFEENPGWYVPLKADEVPLEAGND